MLHENNPLVAQMGATDRLTVAIKRIADYEAAIAWRDERIETLEAIACGGDNIDKAGWWGRFAALLCRDRDNLKRQLAAKDEALKVVETILNKPLYWQERVEKALAAIELEKALAAIEAGKVGE